MYHLPNQRGFFLEEACETLRNEIILKRDECKGVSLSELHKRELEKMNVDQQARLQRKLIDLCNKSMWGEAVKNEIVVNLSSRNLSLNEKEALSYGLKFDSGNDKLSLVEHVAKNYKNSDTNVDKGFVQGVVTCCKILADKEESSLPRRYHEALESLAKDDSIIITSADKGGGIIIMDRTDYIEKMNDLLKDKVYEKKKTGYAKAEGEKFNKEARKILRKSEQGKQLLHTLEQDPIPPRMRGLPKIHKQGIPMRPITSGIASAPHKLAKILAKPLTMTLGSLSDAHLKNSGDLIERLKQMQFNGKKTSKLRRQCVIYKRPY